MKTKTMKILCLILSIVMILGSMPLTVLAAPAKKLTVNYGNPYHGRRAEQYPASGADGLTGTKVNIKWLDNGVEMQPEDTFIAGKTYTAEMTLRIPARDFVNVKGRIYIRNKPADAEQIELITPMLGEKAEYIQVKITDTAKCSKTQWDYFKIFTNDAIDGCSTLFTENASVFTEHQDKYEITKAEWVDPYSGYQVVDTYLHKGDIVCAKITIAPKEGYELFFDSNYDSEAYVNGVQRYEKNRDVTKNSDGTFIILGAEETVVAATAIPQQISIYDLYPYAGLTPAKIDAVPRTRGIKLSRLDWQDVTDGGTNGPQLDDNDSFKLNHKYIVRFFVYEKYGCNFSAAPAVKLSDGTLHTGTKTKDGKGYHFEILIESEYSGIKDINVNLPAPNPDLKAQDARPSVSGSENYNIDSFTWTDETANEYLQNEFTIGHDYSIETVITSNSDKCHFLSRLNYKLNEEEVYTEENSNNDTKITVTYNIHCNPFIESADLQFDKITAGKTPADINLSINNENIKVKTLTWHHLFGGSGGMKSDEAFVEGKQYFAAVVLNPENMFSFDNNCTFTSNEEAELKLLEISHKKAKLTITFTAGKSEVINEIELSELEPVAGQSPSYTAVCADPDTYGINFILWYKTVNGKKVLMTEDDKFVKDERYDCIVETYIKDNNIFSFNPEITNNDIAVDDRVVDNVINVYDDMLRFSSDLYCYRTAPLTPISEVKFSLAKTLVPGTSSTSDNFIIYDISAGSEDYSCYDVLWYDDQGNLMQDNFEAGKKYTAEIIAAPAEGKTFNVATKAYINDTLCTVEAYSEDDTCIAIKSEPVECINGIETVKIYNLYAISGMKPIEMNSVNTYSENQYKISDTKWYNASKVPMNNNDKFFVGTEYICRVTFNAVSGNTFTPDSKAKLGDTEVKVTPIGTYRKAYAEFRVTATNTVTYIKNMPIELSSLDAGVTEDSIKMTNALPGNLAMGAGGGFFLVENPGTSDEEYPEGKDQLKPDTEYRLNILLFADTDKAVFDNNCIFTVNGEKISRENIEDNSRLYTVKYFFRTAKAEAQKITSDDLLIKDGVIYTNETDTENFMKHINEEGCTIFDGAKKVNVVTEMKTGYEIVLSSGGKELDRLTVVVRGDVDKDGKVTASDARLALRASVNLDALDTAQTAAANTDTDVKITASDARFILRVSVSLDKFPVK